MLELIDIKKDYLAGDISVPALKGVSLYFGKKGFVSILGQSGCGKTTLLNIIGGLDRYTSGKLLIGGKSTEEFKDADWDAYRNHCIGFVFQSYNLIPHLTVLGNVELALTLSGVAPDERRKKAEEALKKVGLTNEMKKHPNQLSGGQMQRVAIARAIVNDPDIILADEPTGALDSATSVQIMEILKEISENKLIIMVTHNQSLAEQYSSRIITLLDGNVISDTGENEPRDEQESLPSNATGEGNFTVANSQNSDMGAENSNMGGENAAEKQLQNAAEAAASDSQNAAENAASASQNAAENAQQNTAQNAASATENGDRNNQQNKTEKAKIKRTSMSFFTALSISMKNLFTKKGRTFMTSFAASIGIIGVALVLAISNGFNAYINKLQSDTLANYPITISMTAMDMNSAVNELQNFTKMEVLYKGEDKAAVYNPNDTVTKMQRLNVINKDYVDYVKKLEDIKLNGEPAYSDIQYSYQMQMRFMYNSDAGKKGLINNSSSSMLEMLGMSNSAMQEVLNNEEFILSQYDVVYGDYPSAPKGNVHEVALVVDKYNRLSTTTLNKLGISYKEAVNGYEPIEYKDLVGRQFKLLSNDAYFTKNTKDGVTYFSPIASNDTSLNKAFNNENNFTLKVVGIMRVKETTPLALYTNGILFLPSLTKAFMDQCKTCELGVAQANSPDKYVVSSNGKLTAISDFMNAKNNSYGIALSKEQAEEYVRQLTGISDLPNRIYIYPKSFETKSIITDYLDAYNKGKDELHRVTYSDASGVLSSTMGQMVDIITYVLIAFACVSLIVSSIMIGIITYASVIERTKEIGVLRSIGARKKDIARVFNAETVLIGFVAGLIGVALSYLLCVPLNMIIHALAGDIVTRNLVVFNPLHAIMLVGISMVLTLIGGLVPAMMAAKKDPVVALRTE